MINTLIGSRGAFSMLFSLDFRREVGKLYVFTLKQANSIGFKKHET